MLLEGQKALADHFGVDVRSVRYWLEKSDFPRRPDGKFDVDAITAWRATQPKMAAQSGPLGQASAALNLQIKQEQLATAKEKRLKAQRERETFEGELLPRRAWETFAAQLLSELGDWCEQLPELAEQQVPKKYRASFRKWLEGQFEMRRAQLADDLKRGPTEQK